MSRGKRLPAVARGVYPDNLGFEVRVTVKGKTYPKRFPRDTPLLTMQQWQAAETSYRLACYADDASARPTIRGTLTGDAKAYLETRVGRSGWKSDRSHLAAWTKVFGVRSRYKITRHDWLKQIAKWHKAGSSPKTLRHRARVVKELWHYLDGPKARTPLDGVKLPRLVRTLPVVPSDETILKVADSLKAGLFGTKRHGPKKTLAPVHYPIAKQAYARFIIRALTGQRPSQIGRALPAHIDRVNRIWFVQAGKGGTPVPFPLTEDLLLAFDYFDLVDAWGPFDCRSFSKTLRRHGWPAGIRPYAMRHAFAIGQLLAGTDLGDLQGLLGHTNPTTTRIYAPVLIARLREAVGRRPLKFAKSS